MWALAGWVGAEWGWRTAFRYLPLIFRRPRCRLLPFMVRDRPADLGLPEYVEEDDNVSATPEAIEA